MGKKYFCWNIDDGLEQDKAIVKILRENEMGATFNLNSGMFGIRQMVGRIGNFGIKDVPYDQVQKKFRLLKYHESFRIPEDEVAQVYHGFEIASHGYRHENLKRISKEQAHQSVQKDVMHLSRLFGCKIYGFAYPYGAYHDGLGQILTENGIAYARTAAAAKDFQMPADLLHIPMTGWHLEKGIMKKINRFIQADADEDLFFLMFAHGYEFDFHTAESNWDKFKRICDTIKSADGIICCSTAEALGLAGREG